MRVLHLHRA
jgi:hypothetical protein